MSSQKHIGLPPGIGLGMVIAIAVMMVYHYLKHHYADAGQWALRGALVTVATFCQSAVGIVLRGAQSIGESVIANRLTEWYECMRAKRKKRRGIIGADFTD